MGFYKNTASGATQLIDKLNDELSTAYDNNEFSISLCRTKCWEIHIYYDYVNSVPDTIIKMIEQYCNFESFGIKDYIVHPLKSKGMEISFYDEKSFDKFRNIIIAKLI